MKKLTVGYITDNYPFILEDKKFFRIAKKMNIELIPFNISSELIEDEIEQKAKKCDIIFNDSGYLLALELVKTFESLGKKVVEQSSTFAYPEDKWIFYVKCKKNNIPTPKTILLSTDLNLIKKELKEFNHWPVILKRVNGERGEFVERAKDIKEAVKIIKKFWKNGNEPLPILAQEFILSDSYRVTLINNKIIQTAVKRRSGWKATGCSTNRFWHFKIDKELEKIVGKIMKFIDIKICGIDFLKKDSKWMVIEVNAEPSLKMFDCEHDKMIKEVLKYLRKSAS